MIFLKIKMKLYSKIFKKDPMILKINYCRKKGVVIGKNMRSFSLPISAEPYLLCFGDNITISDEVQFITHDNSVIKLSNDSTDTVGEIIIGNNCFLGYRSLFLPGVTIGDNTIVAAGSVVTKSFKEGNVVIGGNPAKVICSIEDYQKKIESNCFNFKGMSFETKRQHLLMNKEKFLVK